MFKKLLACEGRNDLPQNCVLIQKKPNKNNFFYKDVSKEKMFENMCGEKEGQSQCLSGVTREKGYQQVIHKIRAK